MKSNDTDSLEFVFEAVNIDNYHVETNEYVVNGNYSNFDSSLLYSLIHDKNKICIFYDFNLLDNAHDNHEIMRNNSVVYYYKNNIPYVHSYISNATEPQDLMRDINNFVNESLIKLHSENVFLDATAVSTYDIESEETQVFEVLYAGSFREEEKPYGYIDCDFVIRKYRANDVSSLYLVESHISFTPGKVARNLSNSNYDKWYNSSGFVKIKATRASNEVGYNQVRYGGTPIYKDAFPVNSPGVVSITSSYTSGLNLGYSNTTGFSLDNISIENENSGSGSISHSYNKSFQTQEPSFSAQKDPSDAEKYTWIYSYSDPREETNHLFFGYMFEMNNHGHDLREGDVALQYEYQMPVDNNRIFILNKTYTFSGHSLHNYY